SALSTRPTRAIRVSPIGRGAIVPAAMDVIPAIDIKDGRCVRLYQGDYDKVTVYDEDPRRVARRWRELGAASIHVVDLDGAAGGRPTAGLGPASGTPSSWHGTSWSGGWPVSFTRTSPATGR